MDERRELRLAVAGRRAARVDALDAAVATAPDAEYRVQRRMQREARRLTAIDTESTRNGMSSLTISMTV